MDVFISYSSRDKDWVRGELLKRIEQAGLKAFIDFRDFKRGAPSISECERGVVESRKTLLVLTPNYIESEWGEIENVMAQTLSPANRDLRIIPLLKADCRKPLRIAALTHIDFTDGADQELAWRQLLTALGAPPDPEPPREPRRDQWFLPHPYPMPPNFTGRVTEREMLSRWLAADSAHPLLSIRALGGFGKSALVWHWLMHDVSPTSWPHVVWWSFYEGDASFDHFLSMTLHYTSIGTPRNDGTSRRSSTETLRKRLAEFDTLSGDDTSGRNVVERLLRKLLEPGTLLVLDGFERVLRAFGGMSAAYQGDEVTLGAWDRDCISPVAELFLKKVALLPYLRSKVLLTTRLCPRVLEAKGGGLVTGAREVPLEQMQPADAVAFFSAQGIRGTRAEIESECVPYGYHPLSLRLLAGLIMQDFQQPGDIVAAKRLDVSGDLVQHQHHVLEAAFDSVPITQQVLLGRIACFRSPVTYDTLRVLAETTNITPHIRKEKQQKASFSRLSGAPAKGLDADLRNLISRGLLHHDSRKGRFDLHPIVRRYAYDRLATVDRTAAHTDLRDFFAAVPPPEKVMRLEDLAPMIELYHHTVNAGQFFEAWSLYRDRLRYHLYYQFGAYQLVIDLLRALFPDGVDRPPRLAKRAQSWTLNELANSYGLNGQPSHAVSLYQLANLIKEEFGDEANLAVGLGNMAGLQTRVGALRLAETNLRRRIELSRVANSKRSEAIGHQDLGRLLAYRGAYSESEAELTQALKTYEKYYDPQGQSVVQGYRALRILLQLRQEATGGHPKLGPADLTLALSSARRALELTTEIAHKGYPLERDYVQTHWLLGTVYRFASQDDAAEHHLLKALERCRRINLVEIEADILIDLARLRALVGLTEDAQQLAEEAQLIAERSGYVLQGADAQLELARLALSRGDRRFARTHATEALRLATCDGPPDYTYAAAYCEAGALLASLA